MNVGRWNACVNTFTANACVVFIDSIDIIDLIELNYGIEEKKIEVFAALSLEILTESQSECLVRIKKKWVYYLISVYADAMQQMGMLIILSL